MTERKIKVLVVEDSPTAREFLVHAFNAAPDLQVVGTAADGDHAVQAVKDLRPDVVSMDVNMPRVSGLEATRRIMRDCPVPIVVVSGIFDDDVQATFQALDAGALAFVRKPAGLGDPASLGAVSEMVRTVRLMSEVKVVRRRGALSRYADPIMPAGGAPNDTATQQIQVVAIGASTGGPPAIRDFLAAFHMSAKVPVLIVQHIAEGFIEGFTSWLAGATGRETCIARDGDILAPGRIYVAPDGRHMGLSRKGHVSLAETPMENGLRPAVSYLFRSVREAYHGSAAAILLSGMGKDGARELLELRVAGALTFAQAKDSALVFGMPGEAMRLDAAQYAMAPVEIAATLNTALERGLARHANDRLVVP